jgi:hypothetical protein
MAMMNEGFPPPDDEEAEAPAADIADKADNELPATPAKQTQQEANYREGNPQRSCGLCGYFDSKGKSCDVVEGEISPFGFSDLYQRQDNPFREGEKEGFKGGTKVAVLAPAEPPPGLMQIGRQSYGGA